MIKDKILSRKDLELEIDRLRRRDVPIAMATGCFDVLHRGHVELLEGVRASFPAHEIWIGLNSDEAVRKLKGVDRPIHNFESRAMVIAAIGCVDAVFEIDDVRVAGAILTIQPRVWVKGGDYTMETLDALEKNAAVEVGTIIHLVPTVPGYSTTAILKKV